jgi:hypothetical protein
MFALQLNGHHQAGVNGLAVHKHQAGPALTLAAAFLGPFKTKVKTNKFNKRSGGIQVPLDPLPVHKTFEREFRPVLCFYVSNCHAF